MSDRYHSKSVFLLSDKQLYSVCGSLFTYLTELRINFSSIEYHHLAWQLSHVIEIVYSNKLMNINLNIFDVIKQYSYGQTVINKTREHIDAHVLAILFTTDVRKKSEKIPPTIVDDIREFFYTSPAYETSKKPYKSIEIPELEKKKYETLLNGTNTNNPLFFVGVFLYLMESILKNDDLLHSQRSINLNLYLIKNRLTFSPTLCISYPLFYNIKSYEKALKSLDDDDTKISAFTEIIFDLIKQSAVVNRALISNVVYDYSNFKNFLNKKNKATKLLKSLQYNNLFKAPALDVKVICKRLKIKSEEDAKTILDALVNENLLVSISKDNDFFMWKQTYHSIKKLDINKKQSTMEIFRLKEDTN